MPIERITERHQLVSLARRLGVGGDWHENDQADVGAEVHGLSFDNAGFWPLNEVRYSDGACELVQAGIPEPTDTPGHAEIYVSLTKNHEIVAQVNLATLFAWATGMCGHASPELCRQDPDTRGAH